ncbi:hypothetical protein RJ639_014214 [Escallonia herrerae]|uniref:C2H2-type domain-containing protein n=1 Tax=Escallonia herrerae TaxID=1293975 RepID=A0AA88VJR5_9ASTE|nr:hypothetical protein RJ639_014214 [Escallonia herrerae]
MANCLMTLSRGGQYDAASSIPSRVFECKTCNRQFPSFQALGGHRASHKKPRLMGEDLHLNCSQPAKPKTHECSICGLEFAIGQALGGHMRRHRAGSDEISQPSTSLPTKQVFPLVKKSNSCRRVLSLDLNLTPSENGLEFQLGKFAAMVDCHL